MRKRLLKTRFRRSIGLAGGIVALALGFVAPAQEINEGDVALAPVTSEQGSGSLPPEVSPTPAPTPTPSVASETPTPTVTPPPTPEAIRFNAPFNLNDCIGLLDQGIQAIPLEDPNAQNVNKRSLQILLETVKRYLRIRDERSSSLLGYEWVQIQRGKVSEGLIDNESFKWDPDKAPRGVSALSFEVQRADAYIHALAVYDENDELISRFTFSPEKPKVLRHSLPRREVFHLWRPTTISRIELAYSRVDASNREPRVYIYAGVTDKPEHGKSAMYFLTRAITNLQADRLLMAREDILLARAELVLHRKSLEDK